MQFTWPNPFGGRVFSLMRGDLDAAVGLYAPPTAAPKPDEGKLDFKRLEVTVDPRAEWKQMYRESWRIMRDWFYDLIAKNRYRIFGKYHSCPLPNPEYRSKFIE